VEPSPLPHPLRGRRMNKRGVKPVNDRQKLFNETEEKIRNLRLGMAEDDKQIEIQEKKIVTLENQGKRRMALQEIEDVRFLTSQREAKANRMRVLQKTLASYGEALGAIDMQETVKKITTQKSLLLNQVDMAGMQCIGDESRAADIGLETMMAHVGVTEEDNEKDQAENERFLEQLMRSSSSKRVDVEGPISTPAPLVSRTLTPTRATMGSKQPRMKYSAMDDLLDF